MADGCNLYLNEEECELLANSLEKGNPPDKVDTARSCLNGGIINNVDGFKSILSNPNNYQHKIVQQLLEMSLSNGKLIRDDELKLSKALKTVLDIQKNPQGLFAAIPTYRGPGADRMQHGGELLTTAAIIQKGGVSTSLGNKLIITSEDIISFGQKYPTHNTLGNAKKGTFEADTNIQRKGGTNIGFDTKYTKTNNAIGIKNRTQLERELNGIRSGFGDGVIDEFYFASNFKFAPSFKKEVLKYNVIIFNDRLLEDTEMRKDFEDDMRSEEKNTCIPTKFDMSDFYKKDFYENPSKLYEAAKEYHVPLIGICEFVNFES